MEYTFFDGKNLLWELKVVGFRIDERWVRNLKFLWNVIYWWFRESHSVSQLEAYLFLQAGQLFFYILSDSWISCSRLSESHSEISKRAPEDETWPLHRLSLSQTTTGNETTWWDQHDLTGEFLREIPKPCSLSNEKIALFRKDVYVYCRWSTRLNTR